MGAPAHLWPLLMLSLLIVLFGQPPGTVAQAQGMCWTGAGWVGGRWGGRHQLLLFTFLVCSVNQTIYTTEENKNVTEPLAILVIPEGFEMTLGDTSTPSTFKIDQDQLFLTVIPDFEVQAVGWMGCALCPLGDRLH